jgi:exonuclease VII small subunit
MTATEEIVSRLNPAVGELDAAKTQAAGAADHADDVRNKALAHGWLGIADGMQEVIDRLGEVQSGAMQAVDHVDGALGLVREIDGRMSPAEIRQHLETAIGKIGEAGQSIDQTENQLDDAQEAVSRVLDGGDPGQLLGMIDEAREHLTSARQHTQDARSKAEAEIQEAAQAGN